MERKRNKGGGCVRDNNGGARSYPGGRAAESNSDGKEGSDEGSWERERDSERESREAES